MGPRSADKDEAPFLGQARCLREYLAGTGPWINAEHPWLWVRWRVAKGGFVLVKDMDVDHILATINMLGDHTRPYEGTNKSNAWLNRSEWIKLFVIELRRRAKT
jgi:hypothetical protein